MQSQNENKRFKIVIICQIALLIMLSGIQYGKSMKVAYAADSQPIYTLDFTRYDEQEEPDDEVYEKIAEIKQCEISDITIVSLQRKATVFEVEYQYTQDEEYISDYVEVTLESDKVTDIEDTLLEEVQKKFVQPITIVDYYTEEVSYHLEYSLVYESEEYKKSVSEFLGAPATDKDSKAILSGVDLYIEGYRISYLLEDGGEYYIPCDAMDGFEDNDDFDDLYDGYESDDFYNLNYTTDRKNGTVIGKIKKVKKDDGIFYEIKGLSYEKLSDVVTDWRKKLKYNASDKAFYYGSKPSASEKKLKTDVIYQFVKKAIKGCKTEKQMVQAIHDAIVLRCHYDIKHYSYYNKKLSSKYNMTDTQSKALHMLIDKTGVCENYSRLFKECCDRLFIPCELVTGSAGGGSHMWNRIYLGKKWYHIDVTFADYLSNHYKKASDIRRSYFLKSAYEFMGHHSWYGSDFNPLPFSKSWSKIDRNNIKTTDQLRKAVAYGAYQCRNGKKRTIKFRITGRGVQTSCLYVALSYGYVWSASSQYKNGYLIVTYNYM